MSLRIKMQALLGAVALLFAGVASAASVSVNPPSSDVDLADGVAVLELTMDFTGTPTVGGSIDIDLIGPVSLAGFTPSSFFQNLINTEPTFNDFGASGADNDFLIQVGSFAGIDGVQSLGQLSVNLLALGAASINLLHNSVWEGFVSAEPEGSLNTPQAINAALNGATLNVVPIPAAVWLFGSALGLLVGVRRRLNR